MLDECDVARCHSLFVVSTIMIYKLKIIVFNGREVNIYVTYLCFF